MANRIYKKKIQSEIRRLQNILIYSIVSDSDKLFIENTIKYLESEIGFIN